MPRDRVVIFLDNSAESIISLFGALKAGTTFIMLNPGIKSKNLAYILYNSAARVLISQSNKLKIVKEAVFQAPHLKHFILCPDYQKKKNRSYQLSGLNCETSLWDNILINKRSAVGQDLIISEHNLATIIYTSGTNGEPKGVMSAHANMVAAAQSVTGYLENVQDDIILNTLPLSFGYGLYQVLMAFLFGGTVVLQKSFAYPYKIIERLIEERATGFPVVPTMLAILLQMKGLSDFNLSALRYITSAAAALPVPHIRKFRKLFPHIKLFSMYGLTECKRVSYLPPEFLDSKPDSVGIPMPGVEVSIVGNNEEKLGPEEVGELVVRGPNVMQGYWEDRERTLETFRPGKHQGERLLYTGDLFKKDEEGFLYFVSRKDDLIKTKGERVSPGEIENVLCQMEEVVEAAAIGIPDEILGQAIKVFVVPEKGSDLTGKNIIRYCRQNLESFMVPKEVKIQKSLPKSASGKVNKKKLAHSQS
jgi:acyl-CoA synthetase (AMP-forming)/AMP-acid ligase II